jgi:hypothetical protein
MRFIFTSLISLTSLIALAQNTGIGTTIPEGLLHLRSASWIKTILENAPGQPRGYIGADQNGTITLSANAFWTGSAWSYPGAGSSMYMLLHKGNNRFEFRVRPEGESENTAMVINTAGRVGIGTTSPQQQLSVGGGMVVDQNNLNTGTSANILSFGGNSGEGIGSRRSAGTNQFGLDFYTSNTSRLAISNTGNVGIGTNNPQSLLDLAVGNNRNFRFKNDLVPTLEITSSNNNDGLAGTMRLRNAMEIWPSSDASKAGKLDIRNAAGNATITLNGADGTIDAVNMPAIRSQTTQRAEQILGQGGSVVLESMKVNIPTSGMVKVTGRVFLHRASAIFSRIEINDNTPGQFATLKSFQFNSGGSYAGYLDIIWVGAPGMGNRTFEIKLFNTSGPNNDFNYSESMIAVEHYGKQLANW